MKQKVKKSLRFIIENSIIAFTVLIALEWWQARSMIKGTIDEEISQKDFPALYNGKNETSFKLLSDKQATLIYVVAPWCGVCKLMGSSVESIANQDLSVSILTLSWDNLEDVREFVADSGVKGRVLLGNDKTAETLGVSAFPSYILVDSQKRIIKTWSGYTSFVGIWLRTRLIYVL